jgi:hypothetical protein
MSKANKKAIAKKALVGAALLAASSACWANGDAGDNHLGEENQLGIDHLSLETVPGAYCTLCADQSALDGKTGSNIMPNTMSVAIDPFEARYVELVFLVRDILVQDKDHILLLLYSPKNSPSPQIPTPISLHELALDVPTLNILATYNIPAHQIIAQPTTRSEHENPAPRSIVSFRINLDSNRLLTFMYNREKIYLQAALLKKTDYNAGRYSSSILSELETLSFVEMTCPPNSIYAAEDRDGTLTVIDIENNPNLTTITESAEVAGTITFQ